MIHSAWRAIMSKLGKHPDLGGDPREAALINQARDTLSDPVKRKTYDASLKPERHNEHQGAVAPEASYAERRKSPRHFIDATVSYCLGHDLRWHAARVKDVSVLGIRIQSRSQLSKGQTLVIAAVNTAAPAIHGTVRWSRVFHPNVFDRIFEAGIEFADQITDVEQRLAV